MIYDFEFRGQMPLLMHQDNIEGQDEIAAWLATDEGKKLSKAGDDRTPSWTWQIYLYHDGEHVTIPSDNIMAALRYGGSKVTLKGNMSFKNISQSGLVLLSEHCKLLVGGNPVPIAKIHTFRDRPFPDHVQAAKKLGFSLFMKRARIEKKKHVRVRPRFDDWAIRGQIQVLDPVITPEALGAILDATGRLAGLCDWRPGAEYPCKPGPYGTFAATVKLSK